MKWDASKFVGFDLETYRIEDGLLTPPIVCGAAADELGGVLLPYRDGVLVYARELLRSDRIIVGANIAYDFGCLAAADPSGELLRLIFEAYASKRVFDILIAQGMHAIAEGNLELDPRTGEKMRDPETGTQTNRYSLAIVTDFVLDRVNAKRNDRWREAYELLDGVPVEDWPEEARQYPVDDVENTLEAGVAQVLGGGRGCTPGPHRNITSDITDDFSDECETAWAAHLGAAWGLRTDPERVEQVRAAAEEANKHFVEKMVKLGFYEWDKAKQKFKRNRKTVKRAVIAAYGGGKPCPASLPVDERPEEHAAASHCSSGKTLSPISGNPINCPVCDGTGLYRGAAPASDSGDAVSTSRDTLVESGNDELFALGENEHEKTLDTYVPFLIKGVSKPITLHPNILLASRRMSYNDLIQLMPREGGERLCFRARPGYVYCSVDYSAGELCTLAQVCLWLFGWSQMAETINATGDPGSLHTSLAAAMSGLSDEEMTVLINEKDENAKKFRQAAKAANFGFPGGMGAEKLVFAKRKKNEGFTECPGGPHRNRKKKEGYYGIRFCVLLANEDACGKSFVIDDKGHPLCRTCVDVVRQQLRPAWFKKWPEIKRYFDWVKKRTCDGSEHEVPFFNTDTVRGGVDFTNGSNNGFQGLLAIAYKHALRGVVREAYLDAGSPLYGTRTIFSAHDEGFSEMPIGLAHLAGPRKAQIMVERAREIVPDVCMKAEPALMHFWDKGAEPKYRSLPGGESQLIAWEDNAC